MSTRAWISPSGEHHEIPTFQIHAAWARDNPDVVPKEHLGHLPQPDATVHSMMEHGWIMKRGTVQREGEHQGKLHFQADHMGPENLARVRAHMKEHHPDHKSFATTPFMSTALQSHDVNESKADQLITTVLEER